MGGVPVALAVETWRARNPGATVDAVLAKQYGRGAAACQVPLFDFRAA